MIRETLAAIGAASSRALYEVRAQRPQKTQVTQMREWSFALPNMTRITVANSPVHQIYVGMAGNLAQSFGADESAREHATQQLMESLKGQLLASLPVKRPIVRWERLDASGQPRTLRGLRSFILRHQTEAGNLYLMCDLASRREFESMRDETWEAALAEQLLPEFVSRVESLEEPRAIDLLCTYLSRCEHDLELLVPDRTGDVCPTSAVVLRRTKRDGQTRLHLSCDLDRRENPVDLKPGLELEGAFGAAGRLFHFRTRLAGEIEIPLDGLEPLMGIEIELPRRVSLDQRRRYFRVPPDEILRAHVEVIAAAPDPDGLAALEDGSLRTAEAIVTDLSFAGAGITLNTDRPDALAENATVRLTLEGEGLRGGVELTAEIRRVRAEPSGRGRESIHVGLEFVVASVPDRQATQAIRQYVMTRQRSLLTLRT